MSSGVHPTGTAAAQAPTDFAFEVQFEENNKPIPFRCWFENGRTKVKLDIVEGRTLEREVAWEFANTFVEEAIPFIMTLDHEHIAKYLSS
jgi:hypothetical protein